MLLYSHKISLLCACDIAVLSQHIYFGSSNSHSGTTLFGVRNVMRRTPTCSCRIKTRYITAWWGSFRLRAVFFRPYGMKSPEK